MTQLEDYYRRRAEEFEEIYQRDDPVRQEEQGRIAHTLQEVLQGRRVLEVACGTGYWTHSLSQTAQSIHATDAVREVLNIAKKKQYACPVSFDREDAYRLSFEEGSFNGGLANFWLSHIPKRRIDSFLKGFHHVLEAGAMVFIADDQHTPGFGGQLIRKEGDENTHKVRTLKDGSENVILKNYFSVDDLVDIFKRHVKGFGRENVFFGKHFWSVRYRI